MAVRQRGATWQADVTHQGKRHRGTFASQKDALAWESKAQDALRRGLPLPAAQVEGSYSTIQQVYDMVQATDWSRKRGSHTTAANALRFVEFVGPRLSPGEALSQENVDRFVRHLVDDRKIGGSTVNRYAAAISKLAKRAMAAGQLVRKAELSKHREGDARIRWFTEEEEAIILQTLHLWACERHRDFFIVLLDTGTRPWTELCGAAWGDITEKPARLLTVDGKNGDIRTIPLTQRAWEAIQRQRGYQEAGPFTSLTQETSRHLWDRLRGHLPFLSDAVWYTARHTFASRLVQRGVDLFRVQKLMGHKTIQMTTRYAKLAPVHLVEAISVLEPQAHIRRVK